MNKTLRTEFYNFIRSEEYSILTDSEKKSHLNRCILDSINEFEEYFSEELTELQKKKLYIMRACFISHNLFLVFSSKITDVVNISCHIISEKEDKISNWDLICDFVDLVNLNSPSDLINDRFSLYFLSVVESFKNDLLQG